MSARQKMLGAVEGLLGARDAARLKGCSPPRGCSGLAAATAPARPPALRSTAASRGGRRGRLRYRCRSRDRPRDRTTCPKLGHRSFSNCSLHHFLNSQQFHTREAFSRRGRVADTVTCSIHRWLPGKYFKPLTSTRGRKIPEMKGHGFGQKERERFTLRGRRKSQAPGSRAGAGRRREDGRLRQGRLLRERRGTDTASGSRGMEGEQWGDTRG